MKPFRVQENVPDVYVSQSRDFQMMCNVFDLLNNGVKFDIDTIRSLSETIRCPESLIKYLQHKLGFYSSVEIPDDTLRTILKCFPFLLRNKGSRRGIVESICLFLSVLHTDGKQLIEVDNRGNSNSPYGNYIITLNIESRSVDVTILQEILKYIIPTGYIVKYSFFASADILPTLTEVSDTINITFIDETLNGGIRRSDIQYDIEAVSSVSATTIINVSDDIIPNKVKTSESSYGNITLKEIKSNESR